VISLLKRAHLVRVQQISLGRLSHHLPFDRSVQFPSVRQIDLDMADHVLSFPFKSVSTEA
jgi:hypothetical protein